MISINRRCEPERIAPDTWVIRQMFGEGIAHASLFVNSMVIAGPEPVIVDPGPAVARDDWMNDVFSHMLAHLPDLPPAPLGGQAELEHLVATFTAPSPAAAA